MDVRRAGWVYEAISLTRPHANGLNQADFVTRTLLLNVCELQLILLPQPRRAVATINDSVDGGEVFLLHSLRVRRNRGKW